MVEQEGVIVIETGDDDDGGLRRVYALCSKDTKRNVCLAQETAVVRLRALLVKQPIDSDAVLT